MRSSTISASGCVGVNKKRIPIASRTAFNPKPVTVLSADSNSGCQAPPYDSMILRAICGAEESASHADGLRHLSRNSTGMASLGSMAGVSKSEILGDVCRSARSSAWCAHLGRLRVPLLTVHPWRLALVNKLVIHAGSTGFPRLVEMALDLGAVGFADSSRNSTR